MVGNKKTKTFVYALAYYVYLAGFPLPVGSFFAGVPLHHQGCTTGQHQLTRARMQQTASPRTNSSNVTSVKDLPHRSYIRDLENLEVRTLKSLKTENVVGSPDGRCNETSVAASDCAVLVIAECTASPMALQSWRH